MIDVSPEVKFKTSRSGGSGGQNVNKVETAVEALFHVSSSNLLTEDQKSTILEKLANRVSEEGLLRVRSQTHRSQLENKADALRKLNNLLAKTLQKKKKRVSTRPSKASKEKRLESKKKRAETKENRQKIKIN